MYLVLLLSLAVMAHLVARAGIRERPFAVSAALHSARMDSEEAYL